MRKTDISKYQDNSESSSVSAGSVAREFFGTIGKLLITAFLVALFTGLVVGLSVLFYIIDIANEPSNIDLADLKLNETSHVYVLNDKGEWEDYRQLYSTENRVWVSYKDFREDITDRLDENGCCELDAGDQIISIEIDSDGNASISTRTK